MNVMQIEWDVVPRGEVHPAQGFRPERIRNVDQMQYSKCTMQNDQQITYSLGSFFYLSF